MAQLWQEPAVYTTHAGVCNHSAITECRLLAFLREEEERERLEEMERLRPIGTAVGPYMEYR